MSCYKGDPEREHNREVLGGSFDALSRQHVLAQGQEGGCLVAELGLGGRTCWGTDPDLVMEARLCGFAGLGGTFMVSCTVSDRDDQQRRRRGLNRRITSAYANTFACGISRRA
jgi:hypothetical protein